MWLMVAFTVGNAASALATSYGWLLVARFAAGLPHGAYFGVASLVAASLVTADRKGRAVASVMLGLSFANVVGVPAATWLGQNLGWRAAYWLVALLGLADRRPGRGLRAVLAGRHRRDLAARAGGAEATQVILTLAVGAIGFGGMFAVYTYIVPTITEVGGLPESVAPIFLLAFGLGMVAGTWLAGRLADWSVMRSMFIGGAGQGVLLLAFSVLAPAGYWTLPVLFAITVTGSVLVVALQLRLMAVAEEAQTMGAAMNHASLNVANALGAWIGGLVIAADWGYRAPAVVGAGLAALGMVVLAISALLERRSA